MNKTHNCFNMIIIKSIIELLTNYLDFYTKYSLRQCSHTLNQIVSRICFSKKWLHIYRVDTFGINAFENFIRKYNPPSLKLFAKSEYHLSLCSKINNIEELCYFYNSYEKKILILDFKENLKLGGCPKELS